MPSYTGTNGYKRMAKNGSQLWKQHNAKLINLLFAAFITVAWIISLTLFSSSASRGLHAYSLQELENVASEKAKLVDGALSSAVQTLSAAADNIARGRFTCLHVRISARQHTRARRPKALRFTGRTGTMLAKEGTDFAPPASALRGALGGQVTYAFLSAREVIFLVPVRESGARSYPRFAPFFVRTGCLNPLHTMTTRTPHAI